MHQRPAYDFDEVIDRRGTASMKHDCAEAFGRPEGLLPLWVADMDFRAPSEVTDALQARLDHGIFGYTDASEGFFRSIAHWMAEHHGWNASREHLVCLPNVVCALAMAVQAFTQPGQSVVIQPPVYHPFARTVAANGRRVAAAPLAFDGSGYSIDFDVLEQALAKPDAKLMLLCNPQNPSGRVWTQRELEEIGRMCLEHGVVLLSDEIHMDFARPGFAHAPAGCLADDIVANTVICISASKSFNLAGLQTASASIADEGLREAFCARMAAAGIGHGNVFGLVATQAAYEHGGAWLAALKDYLEGSWALLEERLGAHAGALRLVEAQSTYLAWIDCRGLAMDDEALVRFFEDQAGLWIDPGVKFGEEGSGFVRMNLASPRSTIARALDQLDEALANRG